MNLTYYRTSTYTLDKTVGQAKEHIQKQGLTLIGETHINSGTILHFSNQTWFGNLLTTDSNLLGLLPTTIAIIEKENSIRIGISSPTLLSGLSQDPAIHQLVKQVESKLKKIVHAAAGVEALKPKSVTLYSTTTCPYCKMEATWLDSKHIPYKEVKVDIDQKAGEEMVKKTGQMGVPVTAIQYENGEEEYVVGFDQQRLQTLITGI